MNQGGHAGCRVTQSPEQRDPWGAAQLPAARAADGADTGGAEPALCVAGLVRDNAQLSSSRSLQCISTSLSHGAVTQLIPCLWMAMDGLGL